jgi:CRISPR-associated endonuclease Csn1
MQLHLAELKKILSQFEQAYPKFSNADTLFINDPTSVSDKTKIIKLLTHKVPYYVGPLQTQQTQDKQAQTERQKPWSTRNAGMENAKIYPWNFDTVIDKTVSAENFIKRMTNKCTYLVDQPCLPKDSILYQKYMILNEINKLKINGDPIDAQAKKDLFNDLFMQKTNIKLGTIKDYFVAQGYAAPSIALADSEAMGGTINHKMTSYLKFEQIFGDDTGALLPQIEEAILSITILPDDKEMLHRRLGRIFAAQLESGQIDETSIAKIANLNFSKWGNLSAKLLDGITTDYKEFERTIIDWMWEDTYSFSELMRDEFGFNAKIEAYKKQFGYKSEEELINESYASVPVKRAARQAVKIIRELESVIGNPPAKVFIETPRSNEKSSRTESRRAQLDRLYKNLKNDVAEYQKTKEELEGYDNNSELQRKNLYLYFLQGGRCAYSGDALDISSLSIECNIDHIIPRAWLKDDSFDNMVLVRKEKNEAKKDTYPLNRVPEIDFSRMLVLWESWRKNGLMTDKKFKLLTRTDCLSIDEMAGFINRQLVETSQTTKMVAEILKRVMPDSKLVYQKAETVAEFKREWALYKGPRVDGRFVPDKDENGNKELIRMIKPQFLKVRDLNDLHHAKDAYLTIVVGNVYAARFTDNPREWLYKKSGGKPEAAQRILSMRTVMYDDRKGEVKLVADKNGVVVWDEECLRTVIDTYERNDILVSVRAFEKQGKLFNKEQVKSPGKGKSRIPIKKGLDVARYGGYTGSEAASFSYIRDNRRKRCFAAIPIRFSDKPAKYLMTEYPGCEVLYEKIFIDSVLMVNGHPVTLNGHSGQKQMWCSNLKQLLLSAEDSHYVNRLLKTKAKIVQDKNYVVNTNYDRVTKQENIQLYQTFLELAKGPYKTRPNIGPVIRALESGQVVFEELSLDQQIALLADILNLFRHVSAQSSVVNCKLLGGKEKSGKTYFPATYQPGTKPDIKLVITSVTGLYKKVIDLGEL